MGRAAAEVLSYPRRKLIKMMRYNKMSIISSKETICTDLVEYYGKVAKSSQQGFFVARIIWESVLWFNFAIGNMTWFKTQFGLVAVPELVMCLASCVAGRLVQNQCSATIDHTKYYECFCDFVIGNLIQDLELLSTDMQERPALTQDFSFRTALAEIMKVHIRHLKKLQDIQTEDTVQTTVSTQTAPSITVLTQHF